MESNLDPTYGVGKDYYVKVVERSHCLYGLKVMIMTSLHRQFVDCDVKVVIESSRNNVAQDSNPTPVNGTR